MKSSEFRLDAPDGTRIAVRRWLPEQTPVAAVQIVHGLAEHGGRYEEFARALCDAGYGAYGLDLRGHGRTASATDLGHFADRLGWQLCIDDIWQLNRAISSEYPGLPIALFGHSMGSFLGQQFMSEHGAAVFAAALSGSNGRPPAIATVARLIARFERWRLGGRGRSRVLKQMMFGEFNRRFMPTRTEFDWLSRDPGQVDAYLADPACGFDFTVQLAIDLVDALGTLLTPQRLARIPTGMPVLVISGSEDPVGVNLDDLIGTYRAAGLDVTARIYEGARHELLHELNRQQVQQDVVAWLDAQRARLSPSLAVDAGRT